MRSIASVSTFCLHLWLLIFFLFSPGFLIAKPSRHTRNEPAKVRQSPKLNRAEARRLAARRRAEAARLAALARRRALEEAMRARVQSMIAKDDTRGEDAEIRRVVMNALGNHAGTVVVMDPQTGRVFSIVNQQWAIRETFKPCSTIKLVTGVAGLSEQVIDPNSVVSDANRVSLTQALAYSKNGYFQQVGSQVGINRMVAYARQLGLGSKTGINVSNESPGRVPSLALSGENRVFSHGDGFRVTAVQLATLASTFATHGGLIVPFVPRTSDGEKGGPRRSAGDAAVWQAMTPGMVGSVRYGSGRKAYDPSEIIAGKTGTCIDNGQWVGLFTSYAPLNDPKLAIVVIAKGSDGRNHFPAAVAGRIYRELNSRFVNANDTKVARTNNLTPVPATTEADEEENEENETSARSDSGTETPKLVWGDGLMRANSKVKPTVMTLPQNPSAKRSSTSRDERPRRTSMNQP